MRTEDQVITQFNMRLIRAVMPVPRLRKYVSERAKIIPRRVTGTCAYHQRALTTAIKRARHVALMPYVSD